MPVLNPGLCKIKKNVIVEQKIIFLFLYLHILTFIYEMKPWRWWKNKNKNKKSQEDQNTGLQIQSLRTIQNFRNYKTYL